MEPFLKVRKDALALWRTKIEDRRCDMRNDSIKGSIESNVFEGAE